MSTSAKYDTPNSLVLIGPEVWALDHQRFMKTHKYASMQYSALASESTLDRVMDLPRPLKLYVYVPSLYRCFGRQDVGPLPGPGRVRFVGNVIDMAFSGERIESPWPTLTADYWDKYDEDPLAYEYWFKVDSLKPCDHDIMDFDIFLADRKVRRYSVKKFAPSWRGKLAFAKLSPRQPLPA